MPKYRICGTVVGSKFIGEVTAASAKEAMDKANELPGVWVNLCPHCSKEIENPEVTEFDAELIDATDKEDQV